jgi:hypothetical protein
MADMHSTTSKDKGGFAGTNQPRNPAAPNEPSGTGTSTLERAKEFGTSITQKAGETARQVGESASGLATKAKETASSMASSAGQQASDIASNVSQKAESATHSLGGEIKSLASTLRSKAPGEGVIGSAASEIAGCMEASGNYLEQNDFSRMAEDLTGLVRRYPVQAICTGVAVGFLIGRSMRR